MLTKAAGFIFISFPLQWDFLKMVNQKSGLYNIFLSFYEMSLGPGICGKHFLSLPQKNLWTEKTEIAKCLLFNSWVMKYTVISKEIFSHLAIWQNCCFSQFYHSKIEKETLSNLSFLWSEVFLREREEIFSTYFGL